MWHRHVEWFRRAKPHARIDHNILHWRVSPCHTRTVVSMETSVFWWRTIDSPQGPSRSPHGDCSVVGRVWPFHHNVEMQQFEELWKNLIVARRYRRFSTTRSRPYRFHRYWTRLRIEWSDYAEDSRMVCHSASTCWRRQEIWWLEMIDRILRYRIIDSFKHYYRQIDQNSRFRRVWIRESSLIDQ